MITKEIEQKWYDFWQQENLFAPQGDGAPYSIVIPPPNVTGSLHMGHGFQDTLMDILVRYNRMMGKKTLWQMGTDHAGIATQMLVERKIEREENLTRHDLGREKFIEKVWEWKAESGGKIEQQIKRLGASIDWSDNRFTMDEGLTRATQQAFIKLYDEGLIYRGQRLVNWDPILKTAISDLEVENKEQNGSLWHIAYKIKDSNQKIVIATTRPETLLGDTAIAVNPNDERYKNLIGKKVIVPICNREIIIIADEYVDQEFGSGCVKITPAHDFNDYDIGKRHDLEFINILTPDAKLNENTPTDYQNLDIKTARKKIVKELEELEQLIKTEDHKLQIPYGDRSGAVIEPYLTYQWYVKVESLAEPAIAAVRNGDIKFVPENWQNTYFSWMENIEDWCISRQLWWGHRIPAWFDEQDNIYVGESEDHVREKYNLDHNLKLSQDNDVLDTWFSSALWPFSSLGWPDNTEKLNNFYPTSVLVTGFDIIFFWVARMIMFGLKFTGQVPFPVVYINSIVRDAEGQKMSKSKGNVLDPLDLADGISLDDLIKKRTANLMQPKLAEKIKKQTAKEFPEGIPAFGTDALRFTFCVLASSGRDVNFDLKRLEGSRNFCNKLWNAARFIFMNIDKENLSVGGDTSPLNKGGSAAGAGVFNSTDKWILTKLQEVIKTSHQHLETYRFDLYAANLYDFVWHYFCDWYLEFSKANKDSKSTKDCLLLVLDNILRLLHPIMPFITEEIWQEVDARLRGHDENGDRHSRDERHSREGGNPGSIMITKYPEENKDLEYFNDYKNIEIIKNIINSIRNIRGEMNITPSAQIELIIKNADDNQQKLILENQKYCEMLAKINKISFDTVNTPKISATAICGNLELLIPLEGVIDLEQEIARLKKNLEKLEIQRSKIKAKLDNPNYISRAPEHLVAQDKEIFDDFSNQVNKINKKIADLRK